MWPAAWLPAVDKSGGSKSVEVQSVWEICDGRLQKMAQADAVRLARAIRDGDISSAWVSSSCAAESALADACCFAGGPVPGGELSCRIRIGSFLTIPVNRTASGRICRRCFSCFAYQDKFNLRVDQFHFWPDKQTKRPNLANNTWVSQDEDHMGGVAQGARACSRARGPIRIGEAFVFRW